MSDGFQTAGTSLFYLPGIFETEKVNIEYVEGVEIPLPLTFPVLSKEFYFSIWLEINILLFCCFRHRSANASVVSKNFVCVDIFSRQLLILAREIVSSSFERKSDLPDLFQVFFELIFKKIFFFVNFEIGLENIFLNFNLRITHDSNDAARGGTTKYLITDFKRRDLFHFMTDRFHLLQTVIYVAILNKLL